MPGRKPTCLFSYYGSKSKIAGRYPKPAHDTIIEPFAGGATYSLRYPERQVVLVEKNPRTFAIWDYLLSTTLGDVLSALPKTLEKGAKIDDVLPAGAPAGLVELCRAGFNMGAAGAQVTETATEFGSLHWHQVARRLEHYLPKIDHWRVILGDYSLAPSGPATWFVDPPYKVHGSTRRKRYTHHSVNYDNLAAWCLSRHGQVIVCEGEGADWLPFTRAGDGVPRGGAKKAGELVWTRETP